MNVANNYLLQKCIIIKSFIIKFWRMSTKVHLFCNLEQASLQSIKEKFTYLAQTHFIHRCPVVDTTLDIKVSSLPHFQIGSIDVYQVPNIDLHGK